MHTNPEDICGHTKFNKHIKIMWWNNKITTLEKTKLWPGKHHETIRRGKVKETVQIPNREKWNEFGKEIIREYNLDNRKF